MSEDVRSASFFEAILAQLPDPVLVHDHEMIVYANQSALNALAATEDEQVVGMPVDHFTHPVSRASGAERRRLILEHGVKLRGITVRLRRCDGRCVEVEGEAGRISVGDDHYVLLVMRTT